MVPAGHRITAGLLPDLRLLQDEKWLGFPAERGRGGTFRGLLERQLAAAGIADPAIITVDSLTAQKRLIEAGLGVALMPIDNIREELRIGSLRTIDVPSMEAQLLEAKENLQRMQASIPLTDDEQAAVDDGQAALDRLLQQLTDIPTPAGPPHATSASNRPQHCSRSSPSTTEKRTKSDKSDSTEWPP